MGPAIAAIISVPTPSAEEVLMALLVLILLFTGRARYYAIKDAFSSDRHWLDNNTGGLMKSTTSASSR